MTSYNIKLPELQEIVRTHGSMSAAARYLTNTTGEKWNHQRISRMLNRVTKEDTHEEDQRPIAAGTISVAQKRKLDGKRFIFTSAQNNTFVHDTFFNSLISFAAHNDAALYVSRFTYNKSGFQNSTKDSEELWYDPKLSDFFLDESVLVTDDLVFCGELDILPTAQRPLSGFGNYTQNKSGIIPHAKVHMESLPRIKFDDPRFLYTTGAVTQRNYIQRKAGQKAEFHHVFGALFVEVDDDGNWFARQLIADNSGKFYDLDTLYMGDQVIPNQRVAAINWGDVHSEKIDQEIADLNWFRYDSMFNVLKPRIQFIHDLTDFNARNHHNIQDPHHWANMLYGTEHKGSVIAALRGSAELLHEITMDDVQTVVVESNHDLAFNKWLKTADVRNDPENAELYHTANALIYRNIREGNKNFNIYEHVLRDMFTLHNVTFLREDDSLVICDQDEHGNPQDGIECGMHGHLGPNGRRGAPEAFRNLGRKCNIGHMHSASIIDGVYTAGVTCKLDMGYNKGPTSWSHSHIVTYPNGKRTIITQRNGKWRA